MDELTERVEALERRERELTRQIQRWRLANLLGVVAALLFAPIIVADTVAYWKEREETGPCSADHEERG